MTQLTMVAHLDTPEEVIELLGKETLHATEEAPRHRRSSISLALPLDTIPPLIW